jgi:hypothetical protein
VMRRHIPRTRWGHVARSVIFTARKGGTTATREPRG